MIAGGLTLGVPGVVPEALGQTNANLRVSAEKSMFDNYMSGPQVVEVVVDDAGIKSLDDAHGEPDVTINGNELRMVQARDGIWYGYFADRQLVDRADRDNTTVCAGLDYGDTRSTEQATSDIGITITEADGVAYDPTPSNRNDGCVNVVREYKDPTLEITETSTITTTVTDPVTGEVTTTTGPGGPPSVTVPTGQIGINEEFWPFIQLYDLTPTGNVEVKYNKGGGTQTVTLVFDDVDQYAGLELDRDQYPPRSEVHATITDTWLNIDPTDEDSWTWDINTGTPYYQLVDENGRNNDATLATTQVGTTQNPLTSLMCDENCKFLLDKDAQNRDDVIVVVETSNTSQLDDVSDVFVPDPDSTTPVSDQTPPEGHIRAENLVTFTELEPDSGIFGSYDEGNKSVMRIVDKPNRSTSATIDYNETGTSIVVGYVTAVVDIQPKDENWDSGEEIPVIISDDDANLNSRVDEDLLLGSSNGNTPTLMTGTPFTIDEINRSGEDTDPDTDGIQLAVIMVPDANTLEFPIGTIGELKQSIADTRNGIAFNGVNLVNFDLRSYVAANYTYDIWLKIADESTPIRLTENNLSTPQGLVLLSATNEDDLDVVNPDVDGTTLGPSYKDVVDDDNLYFALWEQTRAQDATTNTGDKGPRPLADTSTPDGTYLSRVFADRPDNTQISLIYKFGGSVNIDTTRDLASTIVTDFFTFGFSDDGVDASERTANQIIRIEAQETGDNTGVFEGSLEYTMLNQLNILDPATYVGLSTIANDPGFIAIEDLTDEDSPRVSYDDFDGEGILTAVADQQAAPTNSGVVKLDQDTYKVADTVTVTLTDPDLNVDSDLKEIYTVVDVTDNPDTVEVESTDVAFDAVGGAGLPNFPNSIGALGRLVDITFDDETWTQINIGATGGCPSAPFEDIKDKGLLATGFSLQETESGSGIFKGTFQIPTLYCSTTGNAESVTGKDIEVNYVDFRDASGEIIEVGDSAGVRSHTGSITLDRTVYPVPWGIVSDFSTSNVRTSDDYSIFPTHATHSAQNGIAGNETLGNGDLTIHVRVNDPDFDVSASGADTLQFPTVIGRAVTNDPREDEITARDPNNINNSVDVDVIGGPIKIKVSRGADEVVLAYAGSPNPNPDGFIGVGDDRSIRITDEIPSSITNHDDTSTTPDLRYRHNLNIDIDDDDDNTDLVSSISHFQGSTATPAIRTLGGLTEISPSSGIFELDFDIRYSDGPASTTCPDTQTYSTLFEIETTGRTGDYCILQGDILTVEYTDPTDASGEPNTVTDSATFDLRNGVLQTDKSVYVVGSDIILTIIEPDWDLDNDAAETYNLNVIEWDSDAATVTLAQDDVAANFDPEPTALRETGDSTGIFQVVLETPQELRNDRLERGEEILLEYTDWGPSGADYVGQEEEDIQHTIFTSNYGATVELDQKIYSWTDKVYVTIVAPDHNFDSDLIDTIGDTEEDSITISTRAGGELEPYSLDETGTDTGVFTGEVILTGFPHDADGDSTTGDENGNDTRPRTSDTDVGPTGGFLTTDDDDGITVSFEFSEDETVVGTAIIRWNIGEVQWLETSYPASGQGVLRVVDPDMNLNPEAVDNFQADVWSDSDGGGISLTVTETNEATGIFEGTVHFTTTDNSSGHRLRVSEGDTITGEYQDNTLPDPYTITQELEISATSLIGTLVPPLERAPIENLRVEDSSGNAIASVGVDRQVQITADITSGQQVDQPFAYLVQIQDSNDVTVSLAWFEGSLNPGQSLTPSLSWTPTSAGTYKVSAFVWESVNNPTALSPPASLDITVS